MATIHFLNVLEGDCNIIQHNSGHLSVIDVSNAYNSDDTPEEKKAKEVKDKEIKTRNFVPSDKINYRMKEHPDNPITYIRDKLKIKDIFRFIITHPDMDHLDGIKDFYTEFSVTNTWDTDNNKELDLKKFPPKFNSDDWKFYTNLRNESFKGTKRLILNPSNSSSYYKEDGIKILAPSPDLVKSGNESGNIHDLSYVLLFTFPKKNGGTWKIVFSGDSHDNTWDYILKNHKSEVTNIDVLFAPHHGRGSDRDFSFLDTLNPKVTLLGNASSTHLAYDCYKPLRITNNQAGYVIIDITEDRLLFLVKNKEFSDNYRNKEKRKWGESSYYKEFDAYGLCQFNAK